MLVIQAGSAVRTQDNSKRKNTGIFCISGGLCRESEERPKRRSVFWGARV